MENGFLVEGVDTADGSRTILMEFGSSVEAISWFHRYVSRENGGNWDRVEVYDVRDPDNAERLKVWENPQAQ